LTISPPSLHTFHNLKALPSKIESYNLKKTFLKFPNSPIYITQNSFSLNQKYSKLQQKTKLKKKTIKKNLHTNKSTKLITISK